MAVRFFEVSEHAGGALCLLQGRPAHSQISFSQVLTCRLACPLADELSICERAVVPVASLADAAVQEEKAPTFFAKVRAVAERTGGHNVKPPLKGMQRCQDKAQFKYKDADSRERVLGSHMIAARALLCWRFLRFLLYG